MGLKRVRRDGGGAPGCWVGSSDKASQHPVRALQAGAFRRALGPSCRVLESRSPGLPARRAFSGLSDALGSPQAAPFASPLPFQRLHSAGFSSSSSALS